MILLKQLRKPSPFGACYDSLADVTVVIAKVVCIRATISAQNQLACSNNLH